MKPPIPRDEREGHHDRGRRQLESGVRVGGAGEGRLAGPVRLDPPGVRHPDPRAGRAEEPETAATSLRGHQGQQDRATLPRHHVQGGADVSYIMLTNISHNNPHIFHSTIYLKCNYFTKTIM